MDRSDCRVDYLTEKNDASRDAWLTKRMYGRPQVDPRTPEQRAAYLEIEWQRSQAHAWLWIRRRVVEAAAKAIAEKFAKLLLAEPDFQNVLPFPLRRSR